MFVGHFGVGMAGKAMTPRVSLVTWFVAVQLVDLLWPVFLLLGWEHVRVAPGITRLTPLDFYDYPITHSLVGGICWAALFALLAYFLFTHRERTAPARRRDSLLLAGGVVSHWVLDVVVHRPDMPVLPHGPYLGWGLWNHPAVEIALEAALCSGLGGWTGTGSPPRRRVRLWPGLDSSGRRRPEGFRWQPLMPCASSF
jgi:hypothetical protein